MFEREGVSNNRYIHHFTEYSVTSIMTMTIFTTQTQAGIIRNQKNQQQILQGNHKRLAVINLETA